MGTSRVIADEHDAAGNAARAERERKESRAADDHQGALKAARDSFRADFDQWRCARPEYRRLITAIKDSLPAREIELRAVAAGAGGNDVSGLRCALARVLAQQPIAAEHAARQKLADRLQKEWEALEAKLAAAKTPREKEDIENEMWRAETPWRNSRTAAIESDIARQAVDAAKAAGLL